MIHVDSRTANADQFDLETLNSLREEHRGNDDVCNSNYRKGLQIVILEHYHNFSCAYVCSDHDFPLLGSGSEFPVSIQLPIVTSTACLCYLGYKGSRAEDINNRVLVVNVILMHCGWTTSVLNMENVYTLSPPIQMFTFHPSWTSWAPNTPEIVFLTRQSFIGVVFWSCHWSGMIFSLCAVCVCFLSTCVSSCVQACLREVGRCVNSGYCITVCHVLLWRHDCYLCKMSCIGSPAYNQQDADWMLEIVINGRKTHGYL